jgi:hypothetical protein
MYLQTEWNKHPLAPCQLGVPSAASKTISEPMVHLARTNLAPTLTLYPNGPKRGSKWPTSPRSSIGCVQNHFWAYGTFSANRAPILRQVYHYLRMDWIELPLEPPHHAVSLGVPKTISEPMVRLAQTMHLSCTDTNTLSKWTETRFHMTHVTKEFHQVHPKWFLSLWYVQCKPCTYLTSILALSPNGLNQASTWDSSPKSTIGCVQTDLWAFGMFGAKPYTYVASTLTLSPTQTKMRFHMTHVT